MLKAMRSRLLPFFLIALALCVAMPHGVSAHEVYVLDQSTVARDIAMQSPNPFGAIWDNQFRFFFWGFIAVVTVLTLFFSSLFHVSENSLDHLLAKLKRYAPLVTRVTLGVCLLACAYFQGLFGPELPLQEFAGAGAPFLTLALYAIGSLVLLGLFTRAAALAALVIFGLSIARYGAYMTTYANYLGEMLITLILGGGAWSLDSWRRAGVSRWAHGLEAYAFLVARVCFGVAVIFAAFYAKFLHSQLALDTITQYHLTTYFPFPPLFIVLGAFIIESLIGLFFIFGIEVRWTAVFFLFWLALSLLYFGEAVWPHLILLGLNLAIIAHGYDRYTVEHWIFRRRKLEPVW